MERVPLFSNNKKKPLWYYQIRFSMLLGCPRNEVDPIIFFHMVVDLRQVFVPYSARWQGSETAWLANHEEGRWASRCWKLRVSFKEYNFMGSTPNSTRKISWVIEERTLMRDIICIFMPFSKPSKENFQVTSPSFNANAMIPIVFTLHVGIQYYV